MNLSIESNLNEVLQINLLNHSITTPTNSQKVCLETSFTSLQSPCEIMPNPVDSSKASSIAGSLFSRSQLNSILHYDATSTTYEDSLGRSMSAGPSEATTAVLTDHYHYRGKSVAFDISRSSHPSTSSPSPNVLPKSILHRQTTNVVTKKPTTLSFSDQPISNGHRNFQHDDWYGMAPLASPETLSEISSISSRTSFTLNLASSIEKYLHRMGSFKEYPSNVNGANKQNDALPDEVYESQLVTPKVMRRTPKITGNLSTCADDWRLNDSYKRMGKVFLTNPLVPSNPNSSSNSSDQSYESTFSLTQSKCCVTGENSKTIDDLDSDTPTDALSSSTYKLALSDSAVLHECASTCPRCPCKRKLSSPIECCRKSDHTSCIDSGRDINTSSTSDTYYSAMSSLVLSDPTPYSPKNASLSHDTLHGHNSPVTMYRSGVLESHFPVYPDTTASEYSTLLQRVRSPKIVQKNNRKRNDVVGSDKNRIYDENDDRCFSRNESLPLLTSLTERNSPSSFVRRKVYPMTSSPPTTSRKSESNV